MYFKNLFLFVAAPPIVDAEPLWLCLPTPSFVSSRGCWYYSWNTLQSRPWWIPSMLSWREELVHCCIFSPTLIRPVVKRRVVFARNHHNNDYYYRYCYFYKYCDEVRWVMMLCLHWKVMMSCLWWRHICRSCWRKVWREMWSESRFTIYVLHTPMWCKLESPPCTHRVHIGTNPFPSF